LWFYSDESVQLDQLTFAESTYVVEVVVVLQQKISK
jgi:hypothetical protein